jgi:hypothetical protein
MDQSSLRLRSHIKDILGGFCCFGNPYLIFSTDIRSPIAKPTSASEIPRTVIPKITLLFNRSP